MPRSRESLTGLAPARQQVTENTALWRHPTASSIAAQPPIMGFARPGRRFNLHIDPHGEIEGSGQLGMRKSDRVDHNDLRLGGELPRR